MKATGYLILACFLIVLAVKGPAIAQFLGYFRAVGPGFGW